MRVRWISPVSTLIDNTYKNRDIRKYTYWRDRFEDMAEKVRNGMFEPSLPREIFIAYSSTDMDTVNELLRVLEDENGLSCFVAARNLRHGSGAAENYREAIHTAMRNCNAVVFVSSVSSRTIQCEAANELNYIKDNLPKMWRIELLTENYKGLPIERIFTKFFDGLEYCTSAQEVALRYAEKYMSAGEGNRAEAKEKAAEPPRNTAEDKNNEIEAEVQKRLAEALAKQQAAETKRKAAEAKRKADADAEAKRKAAESKRKADEAEARRKASLAPKASPDSDFEIENGVLKKYKGNSGKVVLHHTVTAIGDEAFRACENLQSIVIPRGVKNIGISAFADCQNLQTIYCEASQMPQGWNKNWLGKLFGKCRAKIVCNAAL